MTHGKSWPLVKRDVAEKSSCAAMRARLVQTLDDAVPGAALVMGVVGLVVDDQQRAAALVVCSMKLRRCARGSLRLWAKNGGQRLGFVVAILRAVVELLDIGEQHQPIRAGALRIAPDDGLHLPEEAHIRRHDGIALEDVAARKVFGDQFQDDDVGRDDEEGCGRSRCYRP